MPRRKTQTRRFNLGFGYAPVGFHCWREVWKCEKDLKSFLESRSGSVYIIYFIEDVRGEVDAVIIFCFLMVVAYLTWGTSLIGKLLWVRNVFGWGTCLVEKLLWERNFSGLGTNVLFCLSFIWVWFTSATDVIQFYVVVFSFFLFCPLYIYLRTSCWLSICISRIPFDSYWHNKNISISFLQ